MASFLKAKLKRARDSIVQKDYAGARDAAAEVLSFEPENYNANVFLGVALLELGEYDQSEQAYRTAISSSPAQILAWQGLSKFYERTEQWDKYANVLESLMELHVKDDDASKCADVFQKYLELRRQRGTRGQVIDALQLLLPGSKLHPALSGLPPPDSTAPTATTTLSTQIAIHNSLPIVEEIVKLIEQDEDEIFAKEVAQRRMRLNALGLEDLRKEVGREIWGTSKLPGLYNEILNHPNTPDELRRGTEAKILRYKLRYQNALLQPSEMKRQIGNEIDDLVNGVVLLNIPDELAWNLFIESKDCDSIEGYDFGVLRRFINLFPGSSLSKLIQAYFLYVGAPLPKDEDQLESYEDDPSKIAMLTEDQDPFDMMQDAFSDMQTSILAHRMMSDCYGRDEDYQNAIKIAKNGLGLVRGHEVNTGRKMVQVRKAFNVVLATAMVQLFPPQHHAQALGYIDEILSVDPENISALMGHAYIHQAAGRWSEAANVFSKVADMMPGNLEFGIDAREEQAWCLIQTGAVKAGAQALRTILDERDETNGNDSKKARVCWRLGKCYWDLGESTREESYRYFITSLKRSSTYAPAFTSLGIYYSEYATPRDPTRASKCFQKAFELDARESDAALRLASGFAEEREWDLVEVVARRTIEGEGGLDAGLGGSEKAAIARYKPTNGWAWKAIGVVELNRRNFPPAIQAFQLALRTEPDDALSWSLLGEAYAKAGRHAAALKALQRSHELRPDNWMCSYQIGEVQRRTDHLKEAIDTFESVLELRRGECGVVVSLAESYLELGYAERSAGFLVRAESSFTSSIHAAMRMINSEQEFRRIAWKTVTDALVALSECPVFADPDDVRAALLELAPTQSSKTDERLVGLISQPLISADVITDGLLALKVAIVTCSYRLTLYTEDDDAIGSAWFDLALGLFKLSRQTKSDQAKDSIHKAVIDSTKKALSKDPGNVIFWNAFGTFNFVTNATMAQHGYIRALELDGKNAGVWTNLGLLYLHNGDVTLANEAFYRAQTLDPEYKMAWVGQGLVATANGHDQESRALFEHAIGLSADVPDADLQYACRVFGRISKGETLRMSPRGALLSPFFSLDRYCRQRPVDASGLHLFGLVCERLGHEELAAENISQAIALLETEYEATEDSEIEKRYAIANANLGRLRLVTSDWSGALDAFETGFGLIEEAVNTVALRALCQFGSGLAHYHLGDLHAAIPMFESALDIAADDAFVRGQVTVMFAQTLWAIGTEEYRESAKSLLLQCITDEPENLAAVTALAGMGLLTDDETLLDAALSEILALSVEERQKRDPDGDVERLLSQHYLARGNIERASSLAQQRLHADPSGQVARQDLALLSVQQGRPNEARTLLSHALNTSLEGDGVELDRSLRIVALALVADNGAGDCAALELARRAAQKAIVLAPWDVENWKYFACTW